MFSLQQGNSLLNVPLPNQDPVGWFNSTYDSRDAGNLQCPANPPSRFELETLHRLKQMYDSSAEENSFVMSYDEAYNLIEETYPNFMQIIENCKFSERQAAKKAYHGQKGFGIDVNKYEGITKQDLITLQNTDGDLIPYVQKGGKLKLPPIKFIKDFQQKIHDFCHLKETQIKDGKHYGKNTGETPCTMFFNRETRQIVVFNKTSGDLITAEKFRRNYFNKCVESGQIDKPKN